MTSRLTPRQRQVLQLAAGGASNAEIAAALGIKEITVECHLRNVGKRYRMGNGRTGLVIEGICCGDVDELQAYADLEFRRRRK